MTYAIEAAGLVKRFGKTLAVDEVDLAVSPGTVLGLLGPNGFIVMFPLTFGSNVFVATRTLPGWLQAWVKINPVTALSSATRGLVLRRTVASAAWHSVAWSIAIAVVFAPPAVRRYRRVG